MGSVPLAMGTKTSLAMTESEKELRFGFDKKEGLGVKFCRGCDDRNEREKDRERANARAGGKKGKDDGLTPEQRRERDGKALQEKQAKKAAGEAAGGSGDAGGKGTKK